MMFFYMVIFVRRQILLRNTVMFFYMIVFVRRQIILGNMLSPMIIRKFWRL